MLALVPKLSRQQNLRQADGGGGVSDPIVRRRGEQAAARQSVASNTSLFEVSSRLDQVKNTIHGCDDGQWSSIQRSPAVLQGATELAQERLVLVCETTSVPFESYESSGLEKLTEEEGNVEAGGEGLNVVANQALALLGKN